MNIPEIRFYFARARPGLCNLSRPDPQPVHDPQPGDPQPGPKNRVTIGNLTDHGRENLSFSSLISAIQSQLNAPPV
jgi:hypothetical protein